MNEFKFSINFDILRDVPVSFIIHSKDNFQNTSFLLENLFTKVYNPLEIILINDRSLNKEYFSQIVDKYKFINLIESTSIHSDAINTSVNRSQNNWIVYISSNFKPNNSIWLGSLFNSMQNLKNEGVKLISSFIENNSFFDYYKDQKSDIILKEHFLPFNVVFFHKDLFRTIGPVENSDDIVDISMDIYKRMSKRNLKQAISRNSLFV
jgi:hypothetical protein